MNTSSSIDIASLHNGLQQAIQRIVHQPSSHEPMSLMKMEDILEDLEHHCDDFQEALHTLHQAVIHRAELENNAATTTSSSSSSSSTSSSSSSSSSSSTSPSAFPSSAASASAATTPLASADPRRSFLKNHLVDSSFCAVPPK
eukprot:TRINITY_DN9287_c0_g1_i1.p1 TRINITY_DN9287_c0_g1~~TRINITY_DN9287_c0_g1_i1.p1  ORF type:complete len:151 (+),score=68.91 TRINITY_DN9287_c0_g1_i1:26-454(+)